MAVLNLNFFFLFIIVDTQDDKKFKEKKKDGNEDENSSSNFQAQPGRILKIYRTYTNPDGSEFTRTEIVRKSSVIDTYLKIRNSKDESFIKQFATIDDVQKEEMKKEKRRIQEQLRRIRRNQEREKMMSFGHTTSHFNLSNQPQSPIDRSGASSPISASLDGNPSLSNFPFSNSKQSSFQSNTSSYKSFSKSDLSPSKRKKAKLKPDLKLKCGACGNVGHMRTNKACPLYLNSIASEAPFTSTSMSEDQNEEIERHFYPDDEDLVNVEGTKVKLSSKLIKVTEQFYHSILNYFLRCI